MLHGNSQVESSVMSKRLRREISSCHLSTSALSLLYLVVMPTVFANSLPPCSLELFDLVKGMLEVIKSSNQIQTIEKSSIEERLYTPKETNYKKCPKSTLTCFAEEVKVLLYHIPDLRASESLLNRSLTSINIREDHEVCLRCEVNNMESAETFLGTLINILQEINVHSCGRQS